MHIFSVAFCIFGASKDEGCCVNCLEGFGLRAKLNAYDDPNDSELEKWIRSKFVEFDITKIYSTF